MIYVARTSKTWYKQRVHNCACLGLPSDEPNFMYLSNTLVIQENTVILRILSSLTKAILAVNIRKKEDKEMGRT